MKKLKHLQEIGMSGEEMSRREVGEVLDLFISVKGESQRISKMLVNLDEEGVIDDKFYAKNRERSVLLTTIESYVMAEKESIVMPYGSLGENILIDFNPYALEMGRKIQIGEVLFEITQNCTICDHLSVIDEKLPHLLKDDRGIFVKVLEAGRVAKGDKIYLL